MGEELLLPLMYWQAPTVPHALSTTKRPRSHWRSRPMQDAFERHPCTRRLAPEVLAELESVGGEHARAFQRASSAVEGRNGSVSQMQHNHRGLPTRRSPVWTVLHNFDCRASDGTTPAARFFRRGFPDLFESVFSQVDTCGEVETAFNSPYEGAVVSGATYIVRTIFLDEATYDVFVPQNEGMLRPVRVIAPKGSIFNPTFPRATKARFCQVQRMADFTLQALAPVIPEKITAGNSASTTFLSYSGFQPETDEYWIYLEVNEGSHGGRFGKDGWDSVDSLIANTRNNPIEELEWRFPMRTERYELRDVYAAPGKSRGGIGIVRVNRFLVDTIVACEGDRFFGDQPWGIFGGHPGQTATLRKNPDMPGEESWPSKFTNQRLLAGEAIEITTPNSGGYGDPVERDPKLVLDDVLDGFTSLEQAREIYRVAIDPNTMTLDLEATEALRRSMPAQVSG